MKRMQIVKKILLSNFIGQFSFEYQNQILSISQNFKQDQFRFNCLQYKGFISGNNKFLIFRNKKMIEKFFYRVKSVLIKFIRGFCFILDIIGLGFIATIKNNILRLNIGFNHSIFYKNLENCVFICSKRKILFLFSYSYFLLKKVITEIKNFRKLNVYKLKGIKQKDELYVKKNWKKKVN